MDDRAKAAAAEMGVSLTLFSALKSVGYAPGNYQNTCVLCSMVFEADKRASKCKACALEYLEAVGSEAALVRHQER
jgi:hypothetical protein